jgi:phospholipid/cholesterol/gamma-HCH transport system substrate-binding protein
LSLGLQIRRYALAMAAIIAMVVAAALVGGYILAHQRVRFPWQDYYALSGDFSNAQAVTPGQGQTVAVAGVTVGEVSKVTLHDGLARVEMQINRDKLKAVHADATMLLRPKTGLQDMSIQLDPGTPRAPALKDGAVVPVSQTQPQVNQDEVFEALDSDTRGWLRTLVSAGSTGLKGRGEALRRLFKAGAPTLERTDRVTHAIVARRGDLKHLVTNLRSLAQAAATKDDELAQLVDAGNQTFGALAQHDAALRETLARLPGTLQAARSALAETRPFARELRPALKEFTPAVKALTPALPRVEPLLRDATPALRDIRGLVRDARPVVRDLNPSIGDVAQTDPRLKRILAVGNYITNEITYNPPGKEEGFLFWTAWFFHNSNSILRVQDAQGVAWRGLAVLSCSSLDGIPGDIKPLMALVFQSPVCTPDHSGDEGVRQP